MHTQEYHKNFQLKAIIYAEDVYIKRKNIKYINKIKNLKRNKENVERLRSWPTR